MNDDERKEAIELFQRGKQQQEQLDREVPNILQQVDAKILLQFLKGNPGATQLNIINVGKIGDQEAVQAHIKTLVEQVDSLKEQLENARKFSLYEYLCTVEKPREFHLIRNVMLTLMDKFDMQRESASFYGVTPRVWNYMMNKYKIPGYRKRDKKEK